MWVYVAYLKTEGTWIWSDLWVCSSSPHPRLLCHRKGFVWRSREEVGEALETGDGAVSTQMRALPHSSMQLLNCWARWTILERGCTLPVLALSQSDIHIFLCSLYPGIYCSLSLVKCLSTNANYIEYIRKLWILNMALSDYIYRHIFAFLACRAEHRI